MLAWLSENIANIVIVLVLTGIVTAILIGMIRRKRKGGSACSCGCDSCGMCGACHSDKE